MELIHTSQELRQLLDHYSNHVSVGFVPTMGALHAGHISLVEKAVSENDIVVVSVFVNPTQFNDKTDLERYPRNLEADLQLLRPAGCQFVFAPAAEDIYPEPDNRVFYFNGLESIMEGTFRPGHFNGVAQVVSRLFAIVQPDKAYFGLKDFQQLAIIKHMVNHLQIPVEIVPCPIVREDTGLAMSSRNELLTTEERLNAAHIFHTLETARATYRQLPIQDLIRWITDEINKNPFLHVEYVEMVDQTTLTSVSDRNNPDVMVCCVAVWCGKVRLIDNMIFN